MSKANLDMHQAASMIENMRRRSDDPVRNIKKITRRHPEDQAQNIRRIMQPIEAAQIFWDIIRIRIHRDGHPKFKEMDTQDIIVMITIIKTILHEEISGTDSNILHPEAMGISKSLQEKNFHHKPAIVPTRV